MNKQLKEEYSFENFWQKDPGKLRNEILTIWKQHIPQLVGAKAEERLSQLVYVMKDASNQVAGESTAQKVYIKRLKSYLYGVRIMIRPFDRQPGLSSKLMVMTRDFLESIHTKDSTNPTIGIISLVENKEYLVHRREAIWKASQMVYIGNSPTGKQIRVYYFNDAMIG